VSPPGVTITLLCAGIDTPMLRIPPQRVAVTTARSGRMTVTVARIGSAPARPARPRPAAAPAAAAAQCRHGQAHAGHAIAGHLLTLPNRCAHSIGEFAELLLSLAGAAVRLRHPAIGDACAGSN
jgi:hypothetical protein